MEPDQLAPEHQTCNQRDLVFFLQNPADYSAQLADTSGIAQYPKRIVHGTLRSGFELDHASTGTCSAGDIWQACCIILPEIEGDLQVSLGLLGLCCC